MDKDYTLLRAFNLVKAKAGEAICFAKDGTNRKYLGGPDRNNVIAVVSSVGTIMAVPASNYRMAPLSWLEGRPVYEGDEAYGKASGWKYVATKDGWDCPVGGLTKYPFDRPALTWTKPSPKTVKRTVKYLAYEDLLGVVIHVREGVYVDRRWDRLPEFDLSREIEEEEKP